MKRRTLVAAGVGGACALAGAGLAWWNARQQAVNEAFWALQFETPAGSTLMVSRLRGRPLLVNFWATWCPPCVEEMPLLSDFSTQNASKNIQVIGIAVDQIEPVRRFLVRTPVRYPIALAGLNGTSLSRDLGNSSGGLPFSVFFSSDGRVRARKIGRLSAQDLASWSALGA